LKTISRFRFILLVLVFFIFGIESLWSEGVRWSEFEDKLTPYFSKDFIEDINNNEPLISSCKVWGWDVGDFSGDGYNDLAISVKTPTLRGKKMRVLLFADIDGYLLKVGEFDKNYVKLPLEVGVAIRDGAVFITEKQKQFEWEIKGFSYINGSLDLVEEFTTRSESGLTFEKSVGYHNRKSAIRIIKSDNNNTLFEFEYKKSLLPLPVRNIANKNIHRNDIRNVEYIYEGVYWWQDWEDLSYSVWFSVQDEILYITLDVVDDNVITTPFAETFDIYLSSGQFQRAPEKRNGKYNIKESGANKSQISFLTFPVCDNKSNLIENIQGNSLFSSWSFATDNGYKSQIAVPLSTIGSSESLLEGGTEIFYYISVNDSDDPDHPERITKFGTSQSPFADPIYWNSLYIDQINVRQHSNSPQRIYQILKEYGY